MTTASQGAQAQLLIEPGASPHTFDSSSEYWDFIDESVVKQETVLDGSGTRGTRSRYATRTTVGNSAIGGAIRFNPSWLWFNSWLPRILGAAEAADTFALDETLQTFGIMVDRVADVFEYTDCFVSRFTLRGAPGGATGGLLEAAVDIVGMTEDTTGSFPGTPPTVDNTIDSEPYAFSQCVFTLGNATRDTLSFELIVDNMLDARFSNSTTATSITPQDRVITLRTTHPFAGTEASGLYQLSDTSPPNQLSATNSIAITNGDGDVTTFTFPSLQIDERSPNVPGKVEVPLTLVMSARVAAAGAVNSELSVTNVAAV